VSAVALSLAGGHDDEVALAREFIIDVQDGPDTDTPGAIPFNASERGFVELSTAQAIPGLVGASLAEISATGASSDVPSFTSGAAGAENETDDTDENGTDDTDEADEADEADEVVSGDTGTTGGDVEVPDDQQQMPQPTKVDSGLSPSGPSAGRVLVASAMLAGLALVGMTVTRRRGRDHT